MSTVTPLSEVTQATPLWSGRRFMPLWYSQFFSALNDNLFRYGMNAALTFGVIAVQRDEGREIVSLSAAIFILPYLIISGISGQLADKFSKSKLLQINRAIEVVVFGLAAYALMTAQIPLLIICLLLVGTLAAFYGPVKLAITPELVETDQLIAANGAVDSGTFAAILFGTMLGTGLMARHGSGPFWTVVMVMAVAVAAWLFSLLTPNTAPAAPQLRIDWNVPKQSWELLVWGAEDRLRTILLLGNGWFWFVGTAALGQITLLVRDDISGTPALNILLLSMFVCGIGLGAWFCSFLLCGRISLQHSAASALGMGFWSLVLGLVVYAHPAHRGLVLTLRQFIELPWTWMLLLSLVMMAANAGLFVVPMVTMMQTCVPDSQRARLLSLSNIWFAAFIIAGSLLSTLILKVGGEPKTVFVVVGALSMIVSILLYRLFPRESLKGVFTSLTRILYRVDVSGMEHVEMAGPSAVIVANHQSLLDGLLLAAYLPGNPIFAIDPIAASRWWAKPLVSLVDITTLNPLQPMSVRHLIHTVQNGRQCVIFPEGRLTQTGGLMKIYSGPAVIAGKSNAPVVAVRIDGVQFTPFSYMKGILPIHWFPKVSIKVLSPEYAPDTSSLSGRERRNAMTSNLYDLMTRMVMRTELEPSTLWAGVLLASRKYGAKAPVLEDARRNPLDYDHFVAGAHALAERLEELTDPGEPVGMLLPTGVAGVATFFALQSIGRVPAMLNYSAGPTSITAALNAAKIKILITAREFVEKGKLEHLIETIEPLTEVAYLEDLRGQINTRRKLTALVKAKIGYTSLLGRNVRRDDTAVILFTSGSEGLPKGVALSHANLLSNVQQIRSVVAYNPRDVLFNALPIFHAFGLTGGVLVPLLHGVKAFLHPTPLQYRVIPELVYHGNATILFGTDTFLSGYAKAANPYDLYTVRLIVAGAERVRPETVKLYAEKFGVPVYEGYGVTECAPAIALNTPMHHKSGTVGRILPNIDSRLEPVPGVADGARLWVKGPNIMKGYIKSDRPGILLPPDDGWYDTGDIVNIDSEGYVKILGRAKRFAKIGGEMVSLAAVETYALSCWPDSLHAAVSIPDARKGETIVLVTTCSRATQEMLTKFMRSNGATELSIPKVVRTVSSLPLLGSGKTDYVALKAGLLETEPKDSMKV